MKPYEPGHSAKPEQVDYSKLRAMADLESDIGEVIDGETAGNIPDKSVRHISSCLA